MAELRLQRYQYNLDQQSIEEFCIINFYCLISRFVSYYFKKCYNNVLMSTSDIHHPQGRATKLFINSSTPFNSFLLSKIE